MPHTDADGIEYDPDEELAFLRGMCRQVGLDPDGETVPDLQTLAADESLTLPEKVSEIGRHAASRLRERRRDAPAP